MKNTSAIAPQPTAMKHCENLKAKQTQMAVLDRPRREIKQPLTYWEEFVETDEWYQQELLADVPDVEMQAAIEDSDFTAEFEKGRWMVSGCGRQNPLPPCKLECQSTEVLNLKPFEIDIARR